MTSKDRRVAIAGAGPAGLVTARFLKAQGFEPTLFDAGGRVGGQWERPNATSRAGWPMCEAMPTSPALPPLDSRPARRAGGRSARGSDSHLR
jgi:cation diffusion facilitator CzcD-associated flavoprotein CzcO